jgi:hypothetical protein
MCLVKRGSKGPIERARADIAGGVSPPYEARHSVATMINPHRILIKNQHIWGYGDLASIVASQHAATKGSSNPHTVQLTPSFPLAPPYF